jgi:HAD superfamily phosphatase (TIGR01681 family)
VQSTFVLPYERPFGNYGLAVQGTIHGVASDMNREISVRARENAGVLVNDVDYLAAWVGRRHFIDEKLWALSKSMCALELLPEVAQNIVDIVLASRGRAVKCVVLDLDNTLWGGVVGDDGLEGIELGDLDETGAFRSFQLYLRELGRRGILLAVCSKNDEAVARRVFQEHPGMILREEDIAAFVANWEDKATNIRRIRDKLNIGLDSMVFLDDNPANLEILEGEGLECPLERRDGDAAEILVAAHQAAQPRVLELLRAPRRRKRDALAGEDRLGEAAHGVHVEDRAVRVEH